MRPLRHAGSALVALALLAGGGCDDGTKYAQAVCALVDTSGTYADQRPQVIAILKQGVMPQLLPGDSLIVVRIDGDSYGQDNVEGTLTLDHRPSRANAQKLAFARTLDALGTHARRSRHTDITGGMMLCSEYLAETHAGTRTILVFSDLKEELPRGARRALGKEELRGTRVVAMNVKKLAADGLDPARFRARLEHWKERVTASGASDWQVVYDPERLLAYLNERK